MKLDAMRSNKARQETWGSDKTSKMGQDGKHEEQEARMRRGEGDEEMILN